MTSYALCRGRQWILAPHGDGDPISPKLTIGDDQALAWATSNLDIAHERQALLRMCWGWTTEIRALP